MTIQFAQDSLKQKLTALYNSPEAGIMSHWVMEKITGLSRIDKLIHKEKQLTEAQAVLLNNYSEQLLQRRPIQYVLGEAYFCGLNFFVNENVLIPRPETEELVQWVCETISLKANAAKVLDIGTGSGCIAVSIKNRIPLTDVSATDISEGALRVAAKNAGKHQTEISFAAADILNETQWENFGNYDIVVSNPPYICLKEKSGMADNVLAYEPHTALFVADNNPLIFYEKIATFGTRHLIDGGYLFFEINESLGAETAMLLRQSGFQNIEIKKDLQGKDRMVKCLFKK